MMGMSFGRRHNWKGGMMKHILLALLLLFGMTGVVTADDYELHLLRTAAETGNMKAQYDLALMYDKGQGVPQDYQQAVRWYTKAAEAGNMKAQHNLALMYDNGQGVPQDYQQAVRWYAKAAEAGNTKAQYNLAAMYFEGKGIPQDSVLAHVWANLAASQGQEDMVKKRDAIATFMTPPKIAEAQKLAREWKPVK